MSVDAIQQAEHPSRARVLEVSDLPASEVQRYADNAGEIHFERRGSRTFLVSDR